MKNLQQDEIKHILPHRYENLLIDEEDTYEEDGVNKGILKLTVGEHDPLNRNVFFRRSAGRNVFLEPTYMEILALGSIVSMGPLPEGITAFFSSISNYRKSGDIAEGELLVGEVEKGKAKGDFHRFYGVIKNAQGDQIAEGDLMAFAMRAGEGIPDSDKKRLEVPAATRNEQVDKSLFTWKDLRLVFADKLVDYNEGTITTEYTYPPDHIFTHGHFPGNPVMMGITLWMASTDALWLYVHKKLQEGSLPANVKVTADIDIIKSDGVVATEIKACSCSIQTSGKGLGALSVDSTKKLYFRDVVRPHDTLLMIARNITIE